MSDATDELERVDILLVDDRPSNLTSLTAVLQQPLYNLVLANSGPDALAQVLRKEFAVILLDVAMPGMDGFEVASIIKDREQSRLIPILFITASVFDMEHIFRGYSVGAVDYLRKPVDPHELRSKVCVFVELYRQRKQIERQTMKLRMAQVREQQLLRERAEEALVESEATYQLSFDLAPIGIGHATPEGRWTRGNIRLGEILGSRDAGEIVGASLLDIAEREDAPRLGDAVAQLRAGSAEVYSGEHLLATKRGIASWGRLRLSAQRNGTGQVVRLIAVLEDISDQKQIELERSRMLQELGQALRARDDFLALAAHELRTPITPLRLQTAGLLRELRRDGAKGIDLSRLERRLEVILKASDRLEELIEKLLDISRLTVGRMALELEQIELGALVRDVVARLEAEYEHPAQAITLHTDGAVIGRWDRVRLDQMLSNLISNAMKYGAGRPVEVSVTSDGSTTRLSVRDHGIGIPPEALDLIFERFERLTPIVRHGGFGLGLWVVRQIVVAHGGEIRVSSRPGEGSEFIVQLPLRLTQVVERPQEEPQQEPAVARLQVTEEE